MKKIFITFLCIITFHLIPFPVYAQQCPTPIREGYTDNGIHYFIYEVEINVDSQRAIGDQITVLRTFQYSGILLPPSKQNYSEMIDGIYYTGVIELLDFTFEGGNTIATYQGTLNAIN